MGRSLRRLIALAVAGSASAPLVTSLASRYMQDRNFPWSKLPSIALMALGILVVALWFHRRLLLRWDGTLDRAAAEQAAFLTEGMSDRWVGVAIVVSAALSLFLELAMIRWQAAMFPFFAFYKNLSLLSCFAGLGLGYSLGNRNRSFLFLTIPLLCWQVLFMTGMRYGLSPGQTTSLFVLPFREQLNMGAGRATHFYNGLQTYYVLAVVFLLTALAFIPVGQLCGYLMKRRSKLSGYGFNLLGSLAGVLLMFLVSAFWTPPTIWFLLAFAGLLCFYARKPSSLMLGAGFAVLALVILEWPAAPSFQRIYSPYQLLEVGRDEQGLMEIRAAGHYYQRVHDFSKGADSPAQRRIKDYYELPYQMLKQPKDVAVVGAGTGNDVAAALRGGAEHVDAIEIDPAILMLGREGHPERPYSSPRVRAVVNDARSFLRTTDRRYDLIVFGLLDSHTLLSEASSVRLDSFVYTVQAMREARSRLKPGGMISLAFSVMNDELGRKIYLTLQQAFDGRPPICIQVDYDAGVVFLESENASLSLPPNFLTERGFREKTETYANPAVHADVSTDDWPFFYMPQRVYPVSYLAMVGMVLVLSLVLTASLLTERVGSGNLPFFLLGAGFMLVETKSITELGLTFGNSWQVIGLVIAGIMVMAYLANLVVQRVAITRPVWPYFFLLTSLMIGWWISGSGGLSASWLGRLGAIVLLTSPLFFSGIVFSTLLKSRGEISGVMSANLFGAMCGGLLEYNSMYFGFRFLYLLAAGLYLFAFAWELLRGRLERVVIEPACIQSRVAD
jgi:spermidine synthase